MPSCQLEPHFDRTKKRWRVEIGKTLSPEKRRRRLRKFFKTKEAAEDFVRAFKTQQREVGTSTRLLHPNDTHDADEAIRLLKRHAIKHNLGRRPRLADLAHEWIDRWKEQHRSIPLAKLFDRFLETQGSSSQKHRQALLATKKKLRSMHADRVCDVESGRIEDCLCDLPLASYNAHLRRVRSVLAYGMKQGYATKNVALSLDMQRRPRGEHIREVEIFPVPTVELMLRTAEAHAPSLLPFLCVSLFAGVRVEELARLHWSDFSLTDRVLRISREVSKTQRSRIVHLSDNLVDWLQTFGRTPASRVLTLTRGPLAAARNRLWARMRLQDPSLPKHAPHNCLRHLFVSMFIGHGGSIDSLLLQAGHTSRAMFQHYLAIVDKAEAAKYWQLRPSNPV